MDVLPPVYDLQRDTGQLLLELNEAGSRSQRTSSMLFSTYVLVNQQM